MLPSFIIEEIKRRERERERVRRDDRPRLDLPLEQPRPAERPSIPPGDRDSGVPPDSGHAVVIDAF